jgi:lipid-binding SYLF domain-containing protein
MFRSITLLIAGLVAVPAFASTKTAVGTLRAAEEVLTASATAPDKAIPKGLLERAECVGVFPGVKKGAFILGGEFGRGVFTCRQPNGTMGSPAFFTLGGGSVGWQAGGKSADVILLIMNRQGVQRLLQDKFTLGVEAAAAIGPVGRNAEAATDAQMHAEILSWSRSRGVFAGFSLEGTVVRPSQKTNDAYYGRPVMPADLLVAHSIEEPRSARSYVATATQYSRRTAA